METEDWEVTWRIFPYDDAPTKEEESKVEGWKKVWRDGIAKNLSVAGLRALRQALLDDDPRLIQGATCYPYPIVTNADEPVTHADPVSFAAWQGDGLQTVGEIEQHWHAICLACDRSCGFPRSMADFCHFWDDSDREKARGLLLIEVDRAIATHPELEAVA